MQTARSILRAQLGGFLVNGHTRYYDRLADLKKVTRSTWTVVHKGTGETYRIEGGKHAGGRSDEWYLEGGSFNKYILCKSLADALHLLETM